MKPEHRELSLQVVEYMKSRGGTAVIGGCFSSFAQPNDIDRWFGEVWGLPWRTGQYHRTIVCLQYSHVSPEGAETSSLLKSYSSKALFLKNVSPSDSLYASPVGARSESAVFGPIPIKAETSIAFGKCSNGWLAYTGDVNNEEGTAAAVFAMMKLRN